MTHVHRSLPSAEARQLLARAHELAERELSPRADEFEAQGIFPRDLFTTLGAAGLLSLPYPTQYGGGALPYEIYLQVLEELAAGWLTVALGINVHTLSCHALATHGTEEQRERWLPAMLSGSQLGAYLLSEADAGSDAAALCTRAERVGQHFVVNGTKTWATHGGVADFYSTLVRTGGEGSQGISYLLIPADIPGLSASPPEGKMGLRSSPTTQLRFDDARVAADRLIGAEGKGFEIALSSLDAGRMGVAACAVGLAQAAFDYAVRHARSRHQFGRPIAAFQGVGFLLADMAIRIEAGRSLYLTAARCRDQGLPHTAQATMAKVFCTDTAMSVTTDAVQVLGGYGYLQEHPVERWMREAKALQIIEGTNQIQRLVLARHLTGIRCL